MVLPGTPGGRVRRRRPTSSLFRSGHSPAHSRGIRHASAAAPSVAPACARSLSLQNVPKSERRKRASRVQDGMEAPAFTKSALTVLIVDDEELLVRSCARILEHEGYTVQKASRGREALDL